MNGGVDPELAVPAPLTRSFATGEFYVALAPLVVTVLALFHLHTDQGTVVAVMGGLASAAAGAYAVIRSWLKARHADAVAHAAVNAAPVTLQIEGPDVEKIATAVTHKLADQAKRAAATASGPAGR